MSKKLPLVINYANRRVLLDTIASYWPWTQQGRPTDETKYGIAYFLRSGEKVDASGNDELSRDKVITFLDKHYNITRFTGQKCAVCDRRSKNCDTTYSCYSHNGRKGFKRKEENEPNPENVHSEES